MNQQEIDTFVQSAVGRLAADQPNHFLLAWEGSKIPRGAFIDDYEITWTQHGFVQGSKEAQPDSLTTGDGRTIKIGGNMPIGRTSQQIGYYERLEEFGGESGRRQVMVISTTGNNITFPGGTVQKIAIRPNAPGANASKVESNNG